MPQRSRFGTAPAWDAPRAWWLLAVPMALWCMGFIASPLLTAAGDGTAGVLLRLVYSPMCHQDPARSFHLCGLPLALCHRCTSLYLGFLLYLAAVPLLRIATGAAHRRSLPVRSVLSAPAARMTTLRAHIRLFPWRLTGLLPLVLDWLLDVAGVVRNTSASRALTGGLAGVVCASLALSALTDLLRERRTSRAAPSPSPHPSDLQPS